MLIIGYIYTVVFFYVYSHSSIRQEMHSSYVTKKRDKIQVPSRKTQTEAADSPACKMNSKNTKGNVIEKSISDRRLAVHYVCWI
jgi:hypothetical protein